MITNQRLSRIIVSRWSNPNLWRDHVTWQLARGIHTSIIRNGYLTLEETIVNLSCNIRDHDLMPVVVFFIIRCSNSSKGPVRNDLWWLRCGADGERKCLLWGMLKEITRDLITCGRGYLLSNCSNNWNKRSLKKQVRKVWLPVFFAESLTVDGVTKCMY